MPPGKAVPLPTSRPVITGHAPAVSDDLSGITLRPDTPSSDDQALPGGKKRVTVQPTGTLNRTPAVSDASGSLQSGVLSEYGAQAEPAWDASADRTPKAYETLGELQSDLAAAKVPEPPRPAAPDPLLAEAAKDLDKTVAGTAAPHPPEHMIVAEHQKAGSFWVRALVAMLILAAIAAVTVMFLQQV